VALVVSGILLLSSCSTRNNPVAPERPVAEKPGSSWCLGYWTIIPSGDLSSAEITPVRTSQFDVTKWAKIDILDASWDEVLRNWTITVRVSNPTQFSGWGVQAIFTNLGGKELRWPDGFLWLDLDGNPGTERYPFFAIEKTTPDRIFPGYHMVIQDLTFHFPQGIDKWKPISFFIDAYLGGPRPDPMVEELQVAYFPPPCYHATVTAVVGDHQSSSAQLEVWADLTQLGLSDHEVMYDDGLHEDGAAGDNVFGAKFTGGVFGELYTLTAYARDPESNSAENDFYYSPIEFPPLPPIYFENVLKGDFCKLADERLEVIEDQAALEAFWTDFALPDMPMPDVDFETNVLAAVCIGSRPDDCYHVEITGVDWTSENCGWAVYYTETVPGPNCICGDVVTSPFHLILLGKTDFDIMFKGDIYIDPCSDPQDPCLDLLEVASGWNGVTDEQTMTVIKDEAAWKIWWDKENSNMYPPPDLPVVDFDKFMLLAVTMGWESSSGYSATIDSACKDDTGTLEIIVGFHIPGPTCMTLPVITHPWVVMSAERVDWPYYWTTYEDIYDCK
jgi:hypothetical protein